MQNPKSDAPVLLKSVLLENQSERSGSAPAINDHFIKKNGQFYAGEHIIIDFWGAESLSDLKHIEKALRQCVLACKATLLHIHLHHFSPNDGISGVAVLAESHISIHTWPERQYAALDVFMCGNTLPHRAINILEQALRPERKEVRSFLRGQLSL